MLKQDLKMIVKPFYDALAEGRLLGRKCVQCGHIEYPPYLACNKCGCLETEWVELEPKGTLTQLMPNSPVFVLPMFKEKVGDYSVGIVELPGCDPIGTSIVGVDRARCEALQDKLPLHVKPYIYEDDGFMNVIWQLAEDDGTAAEGEKAEAETVEAAGIEDAVDEVTRTVIDCCAEAYNVEAEELTPATNIREDLSNQSMKMIAFISAIEDELDVTIEIREAANYFTIADFAARVKALLAKQ